MKKIPETDAIFEHVAKANAAADADPSTVRISIDSKAKVKVGNLSRGGKDRRRSAPQADDHDTDWQSVVLPFGIRNMDTDELTLYMSESAETPDFIVDCLRAWWQENHPQYPDVTTLAINLDSGGATRSNRTQFIKRLVQFCRSTGMRIELIYYPPYHSKYNPIERYWAALELCWQGAILDSVDTVLNWAKTMKWKGQSPVVHHVTQTYEKGISVKADDLESFRVDWLPSQMLPKWAITIAPG